MTTPKRYVCGWCHTQHGPGSQLYEEIRTAAREAQAGERARILKLIDEAMPPLTNNGNAKVRTALNAVKAAIKKGEDL